MYEQTMGSDNDDVTNQESEVTTETESDTAAEPETESAISTEIEAAAEAVLPDSRNWVTFTHLSAFIMFFGVPAPIGPLVAWLVKSDDPEVVAAAKESLNFNISFFLWGVIAGASILLLIGIVLLPIVIIAWFVLVILAAVRSADGEQYRYPFTLRFIT